jgi:hypothetical protein
MGENEESKVTVKVWGLIIVFIAIYGFFFVTAMAHETRITRVETSLDVSICNMTKTLDKLADQMERHVAGQK